MQTDLLALQGASVEAIVFVVDVTTLFVLNLPMHNAPGVKESEEQTTEARAKTAKTDCEVDNSILQTHS